MKTKLYLITLPIFLFFDFIWLTFVAQKFYQSQIGHLMSTSPNLFVALIFYLLFVVGLVIFVLEPSLKDNSFKKAISLGALFGFITYATYDLTNLATLNNWLVSVTIIDLIWGTILSAIVSAISYRITKKFNII